MKTLLLTIFALLVFGCSSRTVTTPDGALLFKSSRLGVKENVKGLEYTTPSGAKLVLTGYTSDQVEALTAVTEAAVRAAISSAAPGAGSLGGLGTQSTNAVPVVPAGYKLVPKDDPSVPQLEIPALSLAP